MHFFHLRLMLSDQPKFQRKLSLFHEHKKRLLATCGPSQEIQPHFPSFLIARDPVLVKCRQFSMLGLTRGSLGSVSSTTELRPLVVSNCTQESIGRPALSILDAPPLCNGSACSPHHCIQGRSIKGRVKRKTFPATGRSEHVRCTLQPMSCCEALEVFSPCRFILLS